jgi:hypothetical protein
MKFFPLAATAFLAALAAGCGGTKHAASTSPPPPSPRPPAVASTTSGANALQAEAQSAATGDIPDNQVFLVFTDRAAGYSMKYPEGWAVSGGGRAVVIRDKNNIIRVVVRNGAVPTAAAARGEVVPARIVTPPHAQSLPGGPSLKVVYSTRSSPNPVTGKRVTLIVDRYYLSHAGKQAVVDLGTPQGVDNVDAYRLISESFRWR